jgi:hypothetical protein
VTCASNLGPIAKELVVFVIASLAFCAVAIMSHKLDPLDPLDLFETQPDSPDTSITIPLSPRFSPAPQTFPR